MGTALSTSVTGLLTHQRRLDVVASNIANVNTTAYRGSRMLFQDLFSQTLEGGRGAVENFGGKNPTQVGLGVQIASIDVNHEQGSLMTTGVSSDLAIQGAGFFIVNDDGILRFTRDGSFDLNAEGMLIDPATGKPVQGFPADGTGVINTDIDVTNIVIPVGAQAIVRATENVNLVGNLSAEALTGDTVDRTVILYDSLGVEREVTLQFTKTANNREWSWDALYQDGTLAPPVVGSGVFTFDTNGALPAASTGAVSITNANLGAGLGSYPEDPFDFDVDFSQLTGLSGDSDVIMSFQDGYPRGTLQSYSIGRDGVINGVFTNGLTQTLGQVALASFANPGGLERGGSNVFDVTPSSGEPQIGLPDSGNRGSIFVGSLEGSNVDLSREFSDMIVTQRGFQANARTISTADAMLQETVNLVR